MILETKVLFWSVAVRNFYLPFGLKRFSARMPQTLTFRWVILAEIIYANTDGYKPDQHKVERMKQIKSYHFFLFYEVGKRRNVPCMSTSQSVTLSGSTSARNRTRTSMSTLHSSDQDNSKLEDQLPNPKASPSNGKSLLHRGETINRKLNKRKFK